MKVHAPLSNLQLELLKLYSVGIPDVYLEDLKVLIAKYLFAQARAKADKLWDAKHYTDQLILELLTKNVKK